MDIIEALDDLESCVNRAKNSVWGRWKSYNPRATEEEHENEIKESIFEIYKLAAELNDWIKNEEE